MAVFKRDGAINLRNAREVGGGHSALDCQAMHRMLEEYAILGKPRVEVRNGVKVTICPPALARGVFLQRNVKSH